MMALNEKSVVTIDPEGIKFEYIYQREMTSTNPTDVGRFYSKVKMSTWHYWKYQDIIKAGDHECLQNISGQSLQ